MITARVLPALALATAVLAPAGASAQQPIGQPVDTAPITPTAARECPAVEPADGRPLELRLGSHVIRAQVDEPRDTDEGASMRIRLIGCEEEVVGVSAEGAAEAPAAAAAPAGGILRLLHDLRVGLDLAATEDGDCFEARFSIRDDGPEAGTGLTTDRPLALRLCGLPVPDLRPGS